MFPETNILGLITGCVWALKGAKKYLYESRQWHEDCFRCTNCKNSIGTSSFIPYQGAPVCVSCYHEKYAVKCVKCNAVSLRSRWHEYES